MSTRILKAAVEVVAEVGYMRMSVERVTRHAGVSRRTFYECFADLEECFLAVFDERARPLAVPPRPAKGPPAGRELRVTYRRLRVLAAIAELAGRGSGPSNRAIADHAGIRDAGQISKLLGRLQQLGLIEKIGLRRAPGEPNAWRLTARGKELHRELEAHAAASASMRSI